MGDRHRTLFGRLWAVGVVGLALSACGAEPAPSAESPPSGVVEIAPVGDPAIADTGGRSDVAPDAGVLPGRADDRGPAIAGAVPDVGPEPQQQDLGQPAIWPAADVVFETPEEAAADFVSAVLVLEGDPVLGEFQQGDSRSGEIAVLFAGETGDVDPPTEMGILALRQLGASDGWFVIAAMSDGVVIDTPSALDEVPAGTVNVAGEGRGFEGTLVVSAFPPGDAAAAFDVQIGAGGAFDELEPYSVDLDLSGVAPGEVVAILVRGDTGLGSDPGTFSAIPIVVGSAPVVTLPPTK